MNVVALIAKIGADSTEFNRELKAAERKGTEFQSRFAARLGRVGLLGGGTAMIGRGIMSIVSALNEVVDSTEEVEKRFARFGFTMDESAKKAAVAAKTYADMNKAVVQDVGGEAWARLWAGINKGLETAIQQAFIFSSVLHGLLRGGVSGSVEETMAWYDGRYKLNQGRETPEAYAARLQTMKDEKEKRLGELRVKLADQQTKNAEEMLSKESLLHIRQLQLKKIQESGATDVETIAKNKLRASAMELEIWQLQVGIEKARKAPVAGLSGLTIAKSSLASQGVFAPGSDLGGLKSIGEKQLVELRKISGAVVSGSTLRYT
jgi:hypothetical protein